MVSKSLLVAAAAEEVTACLAGAKAEAEAAMEARIRAVFIVTNKLQRNQRIQKRKCELDPDPFHRFYPNKLRELPPSHPIVI